MLFKIFKTILIPFNKLFSLIFYFFTGNYAASYKPVDKENIRLNAAIFSDTHIDCSKMRSRKLGHGLSDCEKSKVPNDVWVTVGDDTDDGHEESWKCFSDVVSAHKPAKNNFIVLGNHDRRGKKDEGFDVTLPRFCKYSGALAGKERDKVYFSETYNGYTFISLAIEVEEDFDYPTDEQVEWFKEEMEKASKSGKPIFVFMHESLSISHGLPYTWCRRWDENSLPDIYRSGCGPKSDEIESIMKQYKNVFYFSGHIHLGLVTKRTRRRLGFSNYETDENLHRINVPCFQFWNHHGVNMSGLGLQMEVYDDRVLFRPRSYTYSVWYPRFNKEIKLI